MLITRPARQQGSTLTGLIIGLIIGLGIAVAVALAITKGSTPFTDKQAKPSRADTPAGQVLDPNKPMYGNRDAAREANKQFADKPKAETAAPAAPAAPAADADPLGKVIAGLKEPADVKPAKPAAAPAADHELARVAAARTESADDAKVVYFLQAGAFRELSDAESTRAKLALLGFEAAISDRTSDAGVLHRVRVGPYGQVEAMNKARAKLIDAGVDVAIVRNQR
ncbi:MAG: SPOR domain-containing protein [Massilia sp.]